MKEQAREKRGLDSTVQALRRALKGGMVRIDRRRGPGERPKRRAQARLVGGCSGARGLVRRDDAMLLHTRLMSL